MNKLHFFARESYLPSFQFSLKTTLIALLFSCGFMGEMWGQCPPTATTLSTQAQVDNFLIVNPGCQNLLQNLTITGADITNLDGLQGIETSDPGKSISITNNPLLTDVSGLTTLTSIGGNFPISGNPLLSNLTGLENLTSIAGYLFIFSNADLENLGGLSGVLTIGDFLQVSNNPSLDAFNGLNTLTSVGTFLAIESNNNMTTINGLNALSSVGGNFEVTGNPNLTNLNAFTSLSTVGGILSITNNFDLTNLDEFVSLTSVTGTLTIASNSSLSDCDAVGICNYIAGEGLVAISNNSGACLDLAAAEAACGLLPVELINFKALIQNSGVKLLWSTATEKNNKGYDIERSSDNRTWMPLGFVPGNGNSFRQNDYNFMDENPLPGINYYRLKQMDMDDDFEYSPMVVADVRSNGLQLDIFPNPSVDGEISIRAVSQGEGNALLEVYDWLGYKVYKEQVYLYEGTMVYPISLATFPKGSYNVRLEMPDGQVHFKKIVLQ